jgi:hypothetical protein
MKSYPGFGHNSSGGAQVVHLYLTCNSYVVGFLTLVVVYPLILTHVLFRIVARALCLVLALNATMASGSFTGFVFPSLPPPLVFRHLLQPLLALFSSVISLRHCGSRLSSLVHHGFLDSVSGNFSLDYLDCK